MDNIKLSWITIAWLQNVISLPHVVKETMFCKASSSYGAFTLDVKSMLNENLDGILGGTQC